MNAERLLNHFERIAEAPDAIARLRRLVLDLAVRGRLVDQNAEDEQAASLLARIRAEQTRLLRPRDLEKIQALPTASDDADFPIPSSWCWTRLGSLAVYLQRGKSPKYAAATGALVVSQRCVQWAGLDLTAAKQIEPASLVDYEEFRFLRVNDLLWNSTGTGTIGRVIRLVDPPERLVCDSHVTVVRCLIVNAEYIRTWLRSDYVYGQIERRAAGSTNQIELTAQLATSQVVPLPPLAEQHRIVAKVDELMALCDQLEAARAERERRRDRLAAASLARLSTPDPATFQADARFALGVLPALTRHPGQIKQFRQTILNLAVRGKLVAQNPQDEDASELARRISEEKVRFERQGRNRRERSHTLEEAPFSLPPSWAWVPIREITTDRGQTVPDRPFTYIDVTSIDKERGRIGDASVLTPDEAPSRARKIVGKDDVIYSCVRPYLLNVAVIETEIEPSPIASTAFAVINGFGLTLPRYIWLVLRSLMMVEQVEGTMRGQAYPAINDADFAKLAFPLPPLAEQHRIVAKVDELMALCDQLEVSLTAADATRSRLLDAQLHEALNGPAPAEAA